MFNDRQIKLIKLLQNRDLSGDELANVLETSRRTVIRDISVINSWLLNNNLGTITHFKGYHLHVPSPEKLNQQLDNVHFERQQILFVLLTKPFVTLDDMVEQTFLPKKEIQRIIGYLREEAPEELKIKSKTGKGYYIQAELEVKLDFIADLILNIPELIQEKASQLDYKKIYDYLLTQNPINSFVLNNENWHQFTVQVDTTSYYLQSYQQIDSSDAEILSVISSWFNDKIKNLAKLNIATIQELVANVNQNYHFEFRDDSLYQKILNHLNRSIAFPIYQLNELNEQMDLLKIRNPFLFDFGRELEIKFSDYLSSVYIDGDLLALYLIYAVQNKDDSFVKILLYAERPSFGNINKLIISEKAVNVDVTLVTTKREEKNFRRDGQFSLYLYNGDSVGKTRDYYDLKFTGIIDQKLISQLGEMSVDNYFKQNLGNFFPKINLVYLKGNHDVSKTLKKGLDYFVENANMTETQKYDLIKREGEGNQLILNHISIPHAATNLPVPFELFGILSEKKGKIENTAIKAILVVLVDKSLGSQTNIFGYLYRRLKEKSIDGDTKMVNYDDLMKLLT
ncbi:transcription regulator [Lactobacillus selangorensis]|uniref:Transcription regulator n=1 Tax=Lactobacillus selangorensis TaxID=81857 RepID=A0A0R2FPX2_9LACO|nr:HTH domain-containing protein [Lactobacillus selangorensis]KRN27922.1 transcription regulator [Lactobacillus selangorensis]KRN30607.1 transcription regulator [Lactobacillus selangorensis]